MKSSHASTIDPSEWSDDYAEAHAGEEAGLCSITDGTTRSTVTVFWYPAPASLAPGGPAYQLRVKEA